MTESVVQGQRPVRWWHSVRCLWALAAVCVLAACQPRWQSRDFVGTWVSSRTYTPVHMADNGEWEIRNEDGEVLQYGVWQLNDRYLVWGILRNGGLYKDPNLILSVEADSFQIREQDGSVTVFRRTQPSARP